MPDNLTRNILIAMAAGLLFGLLVYWLNQSNPGSAFAQLLDAKLVGGVFLLIGKIFVIMLKMLIVPLVFVSIVCGMLSMGDDMKQFGRLGGKTLFLYLLTTAVAITIALTLAHFIQPGAGVDLTGVTKPKIGEAPSGMQVLLDMFPKNPFDALAKGQMLQIIIFSIVLGIAINKAGDEGKKIADNFRAWNEVMLQLVNIVLWLTPIGVFCLISKVFAEQGPDIFKGLAVYFLTVTAALAIHAFGTYTLLLKLVAKLNPVHFFKKMRPVALFAFSTASSAATLPLTLTTVEEKIGVDNKLASFSLPLGATINMDGTAIMQGVATVFIAGAYGADLGMGGYMAVILTATMASIGTAATPGAGLITLSLVLTQVGLPVEAIGLIIGVDRLLDMMRTAVNVTGDASITAAVANTESSLDREVFNS